MKSAFRNLPILKLDWCLLVMMCRHPETKKRYYFADKCLPFRAGILCSHFQRVSNSLEHILRKRTGRISNNYFDDFLFAAMLCALCNGDVKSFLQLCSEINFPVAPEKIVWGTTILVFLGILINTVTQTISIPVEKRMKALQQLQELISAKKITVLKL